VLVDAEVAAWPHIPPDTLAVKVTVETRLSVGDLVEEHPTCRSTAFIDCFSVLDLLLQLARLLCTDVSRDSTNE
jgi:hypothetical protein